MIHPWATMLAQISARFVNQNIMSHSFHKLYHHVIWTTKHRAPIITTKIEPLVIESIQTKIAKLGARSIALNMVIDHVHLLAELPPQLAPADFVHDVKGCSSHYVNKFFSENTFYWQTGYGILTLSEEQLPMVTSYIANQKQHHADNDLIDIFERVPEDSNETASSATQSVTAQQSPNCSPTDESRGLNGKL